MIKKNIEPIWDESVGEMKMGHTVITGETGAGKTFLDIIMVNTSDHARIKLQNANKSKNGKNRGGNNE